MRFTRTLLGAALLAMAIGATEVNAQRRGAPIDQSPGMYPYGEGWRQAPPTPFFTLTGNLDLNLVPYIDNENGTSENRRVIVSCWICTDGSCEAGGEIGPAQHVFDVEGEEVVSETFTAQFFAYVPAGLLTTRDFDLYSAEDISSYYCRVELAAMVVGRPVGLAMPSVDYMEADISRRFAKAENGTTLVVELSGPIN